jgi:hypothetical protein
LFDPGLINVMGAGVSEIAAPYTPANPSTTP